MSKVKGFIGRHKKLLVICVVLTLIITLVVTLLPSRNALQAAALQQDTTTLKATTLTQVVTGSGTVQSTSSRDVTSSLTYEITEVLVQVGDTVTAGQQLVVLDTGELEQTIADTRRSISDANASDSLSKEQAQRKYNDAVNQRDIDQARLDGEVNTAHTTLLAAQDTTAAKLAALEAAIATLATVEETDPLYPTLWATYEQAQQEYAAAGQSESAALQAYNTAATTRDTTLRQDNLSIENAQDTLNTLSLANSAKTYQTQLSSYERQLAQATITAPISGTVTAVNALEGSSAMSTAVALFTIEDTLNLEVPISVAEYDISDVKVGMKAEITSDALDGEVWTGSVASISPVATDTAGNFTVTVKIASAPGQLKSGMSAKANILVEEAAGVFAVPYDAVVENAGGQLVVYEYLGMAGGEASESRREIPVTTGVETDYYIEIKGEGLYEGMEILNDPLGVNLTAPTTGFPMGGGF